jgi:hypothetical protein
MDYWYEKPEEKRPLLRKISRWVVNIETDLRKREDGPVWTGLMWLRTEASGGLF